MSRRLLILPIVVILASCEAPYPRRNVILIRPDGKKVVCPEPPADVMIAETKVQVGTSLPGIKRILQAHGSIKQKYQRIRSEIVNLHAVEVLHFRLCVDYGNGILDEEIYKDFITEILPRFYEQFGEMEQTERPTINIRIHPERPDQVFLRIEISFNKL